ncbi:MAG: hypothetical protein EOO73_17710 [Myxococcales bacterium]|nr:MAG: hypothetical protein EOO73_17710 [Myxococcales bacterium]
MVETKKKKKAKRERKERRFSPEQTYASGAVVGVGMLGALAAGAGVWGQWISEVPHSYAPFLFGGGAIALGASLWFGDAGAVPVRVGDAGIALERGTELTRLAWCDLERVEVSGKQLLAKGKGATFSIPIAAHPKAVAWILAEGTRRVPDVMNVKRTELAALPEPKDLDGELVPLEGVQVAGKHCAATNKPIAFERDARICPNCAQVYLKDAVPKKCVTCEKDLGSSAIEL